MWLVAMLATGAVIGVLAMALIQGRGDAREFAAISGCLLRSSGRAKDGNRNVDLLRRAD